MSPDKEAWLVKAIHEQIAQNTHAIVTSEVLASAWDVRVKMGSRSGVVEVIRRYPGVFLDVVLAGAVELKPDDLIPVFEGNLARLAAACRRNGWTAVPLSYQDGTARFQRAPS